MSIVPLNRTLVATKVPFANDGGVSRGSSAVSYTHLTLPTICSV